MCHLRRFVGWQHRRQHFVVLQAQSAAHAARGAQVIPRDHQDLQATLAQRLKGLQGLGLGRVLKREQGPHLEAIRLLLGQQRHRITLGHGLICGRYPLEWGGGVEVLERIPLRMRVVVHPQRLFWLIEALYPAQTAHHQPSAGHQALRAPACDGLHRIRGLEDKPLPTCVLDHGAGQRVLAARQQAGGQHEPVVWRRLARERLVMGQLRMALRERARLVERHGVHPVRNLQRLRVTNQYPALCRHTGPRHDGHRRGQTQRTRTGNHHHRHRMDQGRGQVGAQPGPRQARQNREHHHHRHKHRRHLIHQTLNRRLGRLRILNPSNDAREHRLGTHGRYLNDHAAVAIHTASRHKGSRLLDHRHGFPGEHGFIHLRAAFEHTPIRGHALARSHRQTIVHHQLRHGHIVLAQRGDEMRTLWAQCLQ